MGSLRNDVAMTHTTFLLNTMRPHRKRIIVALAAMSVVTMVGIVPPLILAFVVDSVMGEGRYDLLPPLMLIMFALPVIGGMARSVSDFLVTLIGQRLALDVRLSLYNAVHKLSCRYMHNTTTGALMERLRGDVQQVQNLMTQQVLNLAVQLVCALFAVGIIFFLSWKLAVLILAAVALYVINYKWFVRRIRTVQRRYRRKMDLLSGHAQERLAGSMVVKAFGNERIESRRFARANFLAERVFHRFRMYNVGYGITSAVIAWTTYLLVLLCGTYFAIHGDMTYGAVMAVTAYTWWLLNPAIQLAELSNQIQQVKVALDRIFELMRAERDAVDEPGVRLPALRGEVTFENLCFQYEKDKLVLRHVNMHILPGQTVALVGHTGCGKSTIINLLYKFYEPQAGHLTIDDHEISTLDTRWLRSRLALVPQDPIVFDTTIAANVAYGRTHATDEQITKALRTVELADLIERHPLGIHAMLGERGLKLSVGEKQRLCIARAILADPSILILDEATSSLDMQAEALIQLALKRVMKGRTCFVVAHRLSTIVSSDLIVVLDQGRIIEMGNHNQLMRRLDGHYRHLFVTQMANQPKVRAQTA
jgi:subfamily B ATP-binding cassette protein MsbA